MLHKQLIVKIPEGLHFRALAKIAGIARRQKSSIILEKENGQKAESASLIDMLTLCAVSGTSLQVTVEGGSEGETLAMVEEVFENGAGI